MDLLIWLVTGAIAGWSAGKLMKGRDYGLIGNVIIGLFGSLVGGWLMHLLGGSAGGEWWQRAVVAALGAVVVLGVARRLRPVARQSRQVVGQMAAGADLESQIRKLNDFEKRVVARVLQRQKTPDPNATFDQQLTFGQRVADRVAAFGGSWTFIGLFLLFMLVWMIVNTELLPRPFDVFPFILLNLILSCLAALQAPVIMMSQNRQSAKDRNDAKLDYEVNVRAETEIARLHEKIDLRDREIQELLDINRRQLALLEKQGGERHGH